MQKQTEFKPVFLYRNDEAIEKQNRLNKEWLAHIQNGVDECKDLFDEVLTDDELTQIIYGGWKSVEEIMRSKSQFPNAKIHVILDLHGKDSTSAKAAMMHVVNRSKAINASVLNGKVILNETVENALEEKFTYYTRSIYQNEILEDAKRLGELITKLAERKIISDTDVHPACTRLGIVESERKSNGSFHVQPNLKRILNL